MATPNPNLIFRTDLTGSLTFAQLDGNFAYLSQSIADITFVESSSHADNATNADNALTASYVAAANIDGQVASATNADNAATASYIDAININGTIANATNADNALTASYVDAVNVNGQVANAANADNATTASYIDAANVDGQVANAANADNATTASYVSAANVDGQVTAAINADNALTASYVPTLNQDVVISGSILISGSIIPNTDGVSTTSSFDLGSPTNAWKDIYVSNGTINFLDGGGNIVQTMGTGNNQLTGDTFIDGKLNQGSNITASGAYSHAEGANTVALGESSHAEGAYSMTLGYTSHAEGTSITGLYAWDTDSVTNGLIQLPSFIGDITSLFPNGTLILLENGGLYKYEVSHSFFAASITQIQLTNTSVNYGSDTFISLYSQIQSPGTQLLNQTKFLGGNAAHSEGNGSVSIGFSSHAEGANTVALGIASHAEGLGTIAAADYQHVAGRYNITSSNPDDLFIIGNGSGDGLGRQNILKVDIYGLKVEYGNAIITGSLFVNEPSQLNQAVFGPNHTLGGSPGATGVLLQGRNNQVGGVASFSHAEGWFTRVDGYASHAEGYNTFINLQVTGSHAEGWDTKVARLANYSHAEGYNTVTSGAYSHAEGASTIARGTGSHAEGAGTIAVGVASHAEGLGTIAAADYQHVAGKYNITSSNPDDLFIIGNGSSNASRGNVFKIDVNGLTVNGKATITGSLFINAPGQINQVIQGPNHSIGGFPGATGVHIQGITNQVGANASYSHVEGQGNAVEGVYCHAEGKDNYIGTGVLGAHAEGFQNKIYGNIFHDKYAHYSHVEGSNTVASGSYSHAEGAGTITLGTASHAEGLETIAKGNFQHVQGQYNATSSVESAFIVGNGFDNDNRSNLIFAAEETVSINNILQLTVRTTNPISPVEGSIMASGSAGSSKLYYYNGTTWIDLTA